MDPVVLELVDHSPFQGKLQPRDTPSRWTSMVALCVRHAYRHSLKDPKWRSRLPVRLRKLIGTVLLVLLVIVYAMLATLFAVARLGDASPLVQFSFFLFSGLLWVLPAMLLIKWMAGPKPTGR